MGVVIVGIVVAGTFFLSMNDSEEQPNIEYSNLKLSAENEVVDYPLSYEFSEDNFYEGKIRFNVSITNAGESKVTENIELFIRDSQTEENQGELRENRSIELGPGESKTENFVIIENVADNYVARVDGISKSFQVINPANNPSLYPAHYYGVAKDYVPREYELPENKNIEGLVKFLDQIEMPPPESGSFTVTNSTVMLEWLLEGAGFDTEIVFDEGEKIKEGKYQPAEWSGYYSWVIVNIENREIAIESKLLTLEAWVDEGRYAYKYSYEPPGIVETRENYFRESSIRLPDITDSYIPYYYSDENIDSRFETAKTFQNEFSYINRSAIRWWGQALVTPNIKSSIPDVEPFSSWVFG